MLGHRGDEGFELGYVATLDAANGLAGRARLPGVVVGLATRFFEEWEEPAPDAADDVPETELAAASTA